MTGRDERRLISTSAAPRRPRTSRRLLSLVVTSAVAASPVLAGRVIAPPGESTPTGHVAAADERLDDSRVLGAIDAEIVAQMERVGATAASIAIAVDGRLIHARGFGASDAAGRTPTTAASTFRLASTSKPFTAAAILTLSRQQRLDLEAPVLPLLGLRLPEGRDVDPRLRAVTVEHLLRHRGGWDRTTSFDPMYRLDAIRTELGLDRPPTADEIIRYMLARPLQFDPGARRAYSNFGYLLLGRVLERVTGTTFEESIDALVCAPLGIEVRLARTEPSERDPTEVHYPVESGLVMESRDAPGGLVGSAPAVCRFLGAYWINGEPRRPDERRSYHHFGSQPNATTAWMEQRPDGVDVVVLFNARRNGRFEGDQRSLRTALNTLLDNRRPEPDTTDDPR